MTPFRRVSDHSIPVLQATLQQFVEPVSGARHVHLANQQSERVFMVAFPTVPSVSDGRAHILEHLALCGSKTYPVVNPFFAMLRRSTATFMNAMTYADRTVYPFASTDRTDFFNLLDVYLDATFFPTLDYLSFRQEGWRHTFEDGRLGYQGVVFNEMKGSFNSPVRALKRGIDRVLFKGTTYEADSGGDPLVIPQLTHAELKAFHASHYHPSQAMFLSAGAVDPVEIQERISERVLARVSGESSGRHVPGLAPIWSEPRHTEIAIPSQEARSDEFGLQMAWLLGESSDPVAASSAYLLMHGLLGDSSAPVMKAMESAGFGRPSALNGSDNSARQIVFHIGMEGLQEAQIDAAEACIRSALECAAETGLPASVLQAALRDLRFDQREIRGDATPDGLSRLLRAVPIMLNGGDVLLAFDNQAMLSRLERQIADPGFFKQLVHGLLANLTCLISRVIPDAAFFSKRDSIESARLTRIEAGLSDAARQQIIDESAALDAVQKQVSNYDLLPRIRPADVDPTVRELPQVCVQHGTDAVSLTVASNGVSYADVFRDVSHFPESDWPWLALYAAVLPELGVGKRNHAEASSWRQSLVPAFGVSFEATQRPAQPGLRTRIRFSAASAREEQAAIAQVLEAWAEEPRFDDLERLTFLLKARVENKLADLVQMSPQYTALAATAPLSEKRRFDDTVRGTASLAFFGRLRALAAAPAGVLEIAGKLHELHGRVVASPRTSVCIGLEEDGALLSRMLGGQPQARDREAPIAAAEPPRLAAANAAFRVSSQVNHCVIAWRVPGIASADAPALAVAAELLSNTLLHQSLREKGGAYGGSASYAEADGIFSMSSYRDPRLAGTYVDFQSALDRLLADPFSSEALEEAIVCVIKRLDKPRSPYGDAMEAWNLHERGVTNATRQQFREQVLACTLEQIKGAAKRWLKDSESSRAAAVGNATQDMAGLQPVELLALAESPPASPTHADARSRASTQGVLALGTRSSTRSW